MGISTHTLQGFGPSLAKPCPGNKKNWKWESWTATQSCQQAGTLLLNGPLGKWSNVHGY